MLQKVYVSPDLTRKQLFEDKQLRDELKARREQGETSLRIYRGQLVTGPVEGGENAKK
jgi:hypothetical protein